MPEKLNHTNGQQRIEEKEEPYVHRSEEVQEIMGRFPSWITRWGISLMTILFIGLLIGAGFFKYPDIIPAKVTISSANPPVQIIARNNLPIQSILVENNSSVVKNQILCILSNTANFEDVLVVTNIAKSIDTSIDLKEIAYNVSSHPMNLGDLQNDYITILQALMNYRFFLEHNGYAAKIGHLKQQSGYQSKLTEQLSKKDGRLKEQLNIQQQRFSLDSSLVVQTVMSRVEYEAAQKELLNQQINTEGNYSTILQSRLQEKEIQKNMTDAIIQYQIDENTLLQKIRDAAKTYNGSYAKWEEMYVLRTPVSGQVVFFKYWKENQFVQAGEAVMVVTPPIQKYIARGDISLIGAGKVKPNQKVQIKLYAYPYEEYGSLKGIVKSKSSVAMDTTFAIDIDLVNGLKSNSDKLIPEQAQIVGIAEIMTENKSLLQRLFENVYGKHRR